jgi:hypothetical protein
MAKYGPAVTNPSLLAELNGDQPSVQASNTPKYGPPVTDPTILQQLNASDAKTQNPTDEKDEDVGAYLDKLPPQEGFFHKLPRNILIGLAGLGHSTLNLPHDLAEQAQNKLRELSDKMDENLPASVKNSPAFKNINLADKIPKQDDYDFAGMLGQKGDPTMMDSLIQGGIKHLPELVGGGALLRGGWRRLIGTHDLDAVRDAAEQFGGNNFSYSPNVINEARRNMPNTEATRQLFASSQRGEYPASYAMRSQLGRHQNNLANSPLAAERLLAPQISDLRRTMLTQLQDGLRQQGMHVEADMLQNGIRNYAQYMRVKNAIMPVIKKWGIPMSAGALLGVGGNYAYKKAKEYGGN